MPLPTLLGRSFFTAIALVGTVGCGDTGDSARLPVFGQISGSDSQNLSGSISFTPAKGRDGLGGTCALKKGAYRFDRTNGPSAGPHDVIIRRTVNTKEQLAPDAPRNEWKLQAEVPAEGPYEINLKLD